MLHTEFGTDLNDAFVLLSEVTQPPPQRQLPSPARQPPPQLLPTANNDPPAEHQQPKFNTKMFNERFQEQQQQSAPPAPPPQKTQPQTTSYTDKMASKKRDMLKIITLAFLVVVALAIHSCADFWIKDTAAAFELSYRQELGIRVLYPLIFLFLIWNIKSFR